MSQSGASSRSRSLSQSSSAIKSPKSKADQIKALIAKNKSLQKRIELHQTKMSFKRDAEITRLTKTIETLKLKLEVIQKTAECDLDDAANYGQSNVALLQNNCVTQAAVLHDLLVHANSLPETEIAAVVQQVDKEMLEAQKWLTRISNFSLRTSPEFVDCINGFLHCEKPFYVCSSTYQPSDVKLACAPMNPGLVGSVTKTVTIIATPMKMMPSLERRLTATLESAKPMPAADGEDQTVHVRGVIMALNDERGSAKITFPRVPIGAEYVISVLMDETPVSNSPMTLELPAESSDNSASGTECSSRRHESNPPAVVEGIPAHEGPKSPTSPKTSASPSVLAILAERARRRSGDPRRGRNRACSIGEMVAVAVAPKRLVTTFLPDRSKSKGKGGSNA